MVRLTIDNKPVEVSEGTTILNAAKTVGIEIPTLCYLKDINEIGACRLCIVEVEGEDRLLAACDTLATEGMVIHTNSKKVRSARRINVELILSQHNTSCTFCVRSGNCALQKMANDLNILDEPFPRKYAKKDWDSSFPLIRDASKCIKCMRCVNVCSKIQGINVWEETGSGAHTKVGVTGGMRIQDSNCTLCGQCITHCPVGALIARDDTGKVIAALDDEDKMVIVQIAPAVRTAWGETVGLPMEKATAGKLVACLHAMGFEYVFDTDLSADLTIMEEGSEFVRKLGKTSPLMTSCCPGWVRFLKKEYPEMLPYLSSAKSPQQMFGAVAKTYYAKKLGVSADKIFVVSIMPCTAKKYECEVPEINDAGAGKDVDVVLTTREMGRMMRSFHIDPEALGEDPFDRPLGLGTGAGAIFGAAGGVMEAALRSAYFLITGENPNPEAFSSVRGKDGWREATFDIGGKKVNVAVASGLGNARKLVEAIKAGKVHYDFVEVMACPGGCAGGGGQPIKDGEERAEMRGQGLYAIDRKGELRFSHENPDVQAIYTDYLGSPLSETAHKYLHTDQTNWTLK